MTDLLEQLAQSCTFTTLNGRLTQVEDGEVVASNRLILPKGLVVDSKYQIVQLIGQGGMGAIYKVHHLALQKEMALKTFRSHGLSADSWHRFQREAQAIARLDHENIVHVFDFGITPENLPYYTMELLIGQSLSDELKRCERIAPAAALKIFRQIAAALAHAHRQSIVHRDIKPGNIFLATENQNEKSPHRAKLVDFGIAKLAENTVMQDELSLTRAGTIFGSPLYMSPEQSLSLPTDLRTDMYSFGCTLYHALTGKPPFIGKTAYMTITLHQTQAAPSLRDSGVDFVFPQRLEKLMARLLAKKPEKRYENFDEIEAELRWCRRAIQGDKPATAPGASTLAKIPSSGFLGEDTQIIQPESTKKSNRFLVLLAISAVGLISIAVFLTWGLLQKPPAKKPSPPVAVSRPQENDRFLVASNDKEKTFRFPEDMSYGALKFGTKHYKCSGIVKVPAKAKLLFFPEAAFQEHPELFRRFGPNDLHGVQLDYFGDFWKDQHIVEISKLTGLKRLQVGGLRKVTPSTITLINKLEKLKYLSFSASEASSEDLIHLKALPNIELLRVSGVSNLPVLFKFLASHDVHIKALFANTSELTEADYSTVTKIKTLVYFSCQNDTITNEFLRKIDTTPKWLGLNISGNPINDGAIDTLSKYKDLQFLDLDYGRFSRPALQRLQKNLPNCKILDLDGFPFEGVCSKILEPLDD